MRHFRPAPLAALLLAAALAACSDAPDRIAPTAPARGPVDPDADGGGAGGAKGVFHRYVAIGTSVSEGWRADGVLAASQQTSWPAQLARLANRELSLPRIAFPGCGAPLVTPLASGLRLSGEPASAPFLTRGCAANEAGVTLPAGNVAISGARTSHALTATPEQPDPSYAPLYARTLAPGQSQVTAMEAQHPKIVSVELGANEVLGARDGAYLPGQTVVPVPFWAPDYRQVVARVAATAKHAVLVGLLDDAAAFPSFRRGAELWNARATFAPLHVTVAADCEGSQNLVFVAVRVPVAAAQGAARRNAGESPAVLSCANAPAVGPNGQVIRDYVLSPAELSQLNAQLAQMNAVVREEAARHGFAYFALGALYEEANAKAPFSAVALMTAPEPYGPLVSADGLHPSAAGSRVLALAAARALNARYRFRIPVGP
jgi:lysophospholipase L1-like esterase